MAVVSALIAPLPWKVIFIKHDPGLQYGFRMFGIEQLIREGAP
jgi:hypothetical protein